MMPISQENQAFYASLVVEHIVPQGKGFAFRRWQSKITNAAKRHEGFLRTDLCPPLRCQDGVVKWYSVIHFDSPTHLQRWIESDEREKLLEDGQKIVRAYRFKSFTTGFEGWFSHHAGSERSGLGPPAWKQMMAVVLGLYPTVMIQTMIFAALSIFQSWPSASVMLANNLITSSILSWVIMPRITQVLKFWLQPAFQLPSVKNDLLGATIVTLSLGAMMALFNQLQQR
jgi:uncharacterized protein